MKKLVVGSMAACAASALVMLLTVACSNNGAVVPDIALGGNAGEPSDAASGGHAGSSAGGASAGAAGSAGAAPECTDLKLLSACDPDGDGFLNECAGICQYDASGTMACLTFGALGMPSTWGEGRLCGGEATTCDHVCHAGNCVATSATGPSSQGAACRPTAASNICQGQCQNGSCVDLGNTACAYGRSPAGAGNCVLQACDTTNASCWTPFLPPGTVCDDNNAATINDTCVVAGSSETCQGQ